jgi:uncharacterized Zn-binding protein involved in type VI secretion
MGLAVARLGDKSDHGGKIITACVETFAEGQLIARVTDKHDCPIAGHGVTPIQTGSSQYIVEGQQAARTNSVCGCGAKIIGGSLKTFCD